MPKRLVLLNAALVAVAAVCALYVARQLLSQTPLPLPGRPSAPAPSAAPAPPPRPEAGAYGVVASRNLFSPTRSDTQVVARDGGMAVPVVKPILHGVVLREDAPVAYLEDPSIKRVAGYRVGDSIVDCLGRDPPTAVVPDRSMTSGVELRTARHPPNASPRPAPRREARRH